MMGGGEDDGPKITRENEKECVHPLGSSGFAGAGTRELRLC
jgi:hypothetical protein